MSCLTFSFELTFFCTEAGDFVPLSLCTGCPQIEQSVNQEICIKENLTNVMYKRVRSETLEMTPCYYKYTKMGNIICNNIVFQAGT